MNYYLNEKVDGVMVITGDYAMNTDEVRRYMKWNIIPKIYIDLLGCNGFHIDDRFIEYNYDGDRINSYIIEDKELQKKIADVTYNFHKEDNFKILYGATVLCHYEKDEYKEGKGYKFYERENGLGK